MTLSAKKPKLKPIPTKERQPRRFKAQIALEKISKENQERFKTSTDSASAISKPFQI